MTNVIDGTQRIERSDDRCGLLVTLARRRALDRLRRRGAYRRATENLKSDIDNPLIKEIIIGSKLLENSDLSPSLTRVIQLLPEAQK